MEIYRLGVNIAVGCLVVPYLHTIAIAPGYDYTLESGAKQTIWWL